MASARPIKRKDGTVCSYQIRVHKGYDADGKQLAPYSYTWHIPEGMTNPRTIKKELEKAKALFEVQCKAGLVATEHKTFAEYSQYVMTLKKRDTKQSTFERYEDMLKRINVDFGHLKLENIRGEGLTRFYLKLGQPGQNKKTGGGLSEKTILEHHHLISMIFNQAKKEGIISINPAECATPPVVRKKEAEFFEVEELKKIMSCLEKEPLKWQAITRLMIDTGARRGEIMALRWSSIDFKNSKVEIKRNLLYSADRGIYEDTPKTGKSRTITVNPSVMELLRRYKKEQSLLRLKMGEHWENTGYCFTRDNGQPMHPDSPTDYLNKFSKKYELPHIHPHKFRHSQVSLLMHAGVDLVTISKRVGHAQASTTSNIYAHLLAKADSEASDAISDLLYEKKKA